MALDESKVLRRTPNLNLPVYKDGELGWGEAVADLADKVDSSVAAITVVNGARWLFGSTLPGTALGQNGDLYLNIVDGKIYQKNVTWAFVASFTDLVAANVQSATAIAQAAAAAAQLAQVETETAINNIGFDIEAVAENAALSTANRIAAQAAQTAAEAAQLAAANSQTAANVSEVAAAASAGLADTAATNAEASETAAEAAQAAAEDARDLAATYVDRLIGTSVTSVSVGTGTKTFETQADRIWADGQRLRASNPAGTLVMEGAATYAGTTLQLAVDYTLGSGTGAEWNLSVTGARGATGATGATGAAGADGDDGADGADGVSTGIAFTFDASTTIADPGDGDVRFNNATLASVTSIAVDDLSSVTGNPNVAAWVATWDDSDSSNKGLLIIQKLGAQENFAIFNVTSVSVLSGYSAVSVTHVASSGSFSAADVLQLSFYATGDKGEDGAGTGDMLKSVYDPTNIEASAFARANHTGTQSADTITDGSTNKAYTAAEQTKLAGIATGATANSSDATLLARANHTGSQAASTISDFSTAADARISAAVGVSVQAYSANLDEYAAVNPTSAGLALLDDADNAAQRTTLGLAIGTDVQAYDADLAAVAGLSSSGMIARTGAGTAASRTITGTANQITVTNGDGVSGNPTLSLPADVLVPTVLTVPNSGLHILDTNATHDLIITPGSNLTADRVFTLTTGDAARTLDISAASVTVSSFGATLVDDADQSTARSTLGLVIGTNVQAYDADLATIAGLTATTDNFIQSVSSAWASRTPAQAVVSLQGSGLDVDAAGFRGIPQNAQTGNYTCIASDAGKEIYHASGAGSGDTYTIPSNASVAYEIGTAITFTNMDSNALSIAIDSDTMYLAGAGTTGTRSLAQYGTAVAVKKTSTTWLISGVNLT